LKRAGLSTERQLLLRPVSTSDLAAFYQQQVDPVACALAVFQPRPRDAFMSHWEGILADPHVEVRTVELAGVPVGYVAAFERDGRWEVAYWLDRDVWGRGAGSSALQQFVARVAHRPLFATVAVSNVPSQRVLKNCAFVEIDRQRGGDGLEEAVFRLS
jgi:RimJ/RimL family protein N-acetyltransferase